MNTILNKNIRDKIIFNGKRYIKKQLIDYMEGLPKQLVAFIKMNISQPYMDPSIYNSTTRIMHPEASILKYLRLNKNLKIVETDNADKSNYQVEYCRLMKSISSSDINPKLKLTIRSITNLESYNLETLKKLEFHIANINELTNNEYDFIFRYVIPYKIKCYMAYDEFVNTELDVIYHSEQLLDTYKDVIEAYPNEYNMAEPLYRYYKLIGITIDEFPKCIKRIPVDTEKLFQSIKNLYDNNVKVTNTYSNPGNIKTKIIKFNNDDNSINGYMINITSTKSIDGLEDITDVINRFSNKIHIMKELRNSKLSSSNPENLNDITFELSENDYGNLRSGDEPNIYAGTIYSENGNMYHILNKDDINYLAFKNVNESTCIYGISLDKKDDGINILKFFNKTNSIYNVELPY